ncbi:hypothetical protein MSHO_36760 [Mycobacterium shottsii]|uniref:Helicase-associated domain-containing protein n=2 Tax=Mycobacterium shottsii TaxID=133549 RepID=A0A7I7LE58_9MYCO|nr:hypothetical protein MSHO_36760 [Mycobacterium shottsii]
MLPGWSWDPLADAWEARYAQLADYVTRCGTSRAPQSGDADEGVLGRWVQKQRNNFAAGKLSSEQIKRLEALPDWRWSRFKAGARSKRLSDDEKREFRRRAASGEPILELAAEFGIGRTTAYRLVGSDS